MSRSPLSRPLTGPATCLAAAVLFLGACSGGDSASSAASAAMTGDILMEDPSSPGSKVRNHQAVDDDSPAAPWDTEPFDVSSLPAVGDEVLTGGNQVIKVTGVEADAPTPEGAYDPSPGFRYVLIDVDMMSRAPIVLGLNSTRFRATSLDGVGYAFPGVVSLAMPDNGSLTMPKNEFGPGQIILEVPEESKGFVLLYDPIDDPDGEQITNPEPVAWIPLA